MKKILPYIFWGILVVIVALASFTPVLAAEPYISVGKTLPTLGGEPVGAISAGVRGERYGVEATYINEVDLYPGLTDHSITMLTAYRFWQADRKFLWGTAEFVMGMSFKSADRCDYNGETNCNRRMPLPYAFHFGVGLEYKYVRFDLYHDSNDALDTGPEKKNLGVNWLMLTYKVMR